MEQFAVLEKKNFNDFIRILASREKVMAPVKKGVKSYVFDEVKSGNEIALKYIPTVLPPKKYFMPQYETLIEFNKDDNKWEPVLEYEKMVLFGVHTCDLAGIQCLNMIFSDKPKDINYIARKNKIAIIGIECEDYCDEYASCAVMDSHLPNGGYDLFFTDIGSSFMVHVNTVLGEDLINQTGFFKSPKKKETEALKKIREKKKTIFKPEVNVGHKDLKSVFDNALNSSVWEDIDKRCLACGTCTNVCPTCYCFDIQDQIDFDFKAGKRYRVWDSCQNEEFAKVSAGEDKAFSEGENFRKTRGERQRHRYMRKFKYPVDKKYSRYFCTGCGRCSRFCVAGINLKETINEIAGEQNKKK